MTTESDHTFGDLKLTDSELALILKVLNVLVDNTVQPQIEDWATDNEGCDLEDLLDTIGLLVRDASTTMHHRGREIRVFNALRLKKTLDRFSRRLRRAADAVLAVKRITDDEHAEFRFLMSGINQASDKNSDDEIIAQQLKLLHGYR